MSASRSGCSSSIPAVCCRTVPGDTPPGGRGVCPSADILSSLRYSFLEIRKINAVHENVRARISLFLFSDRLYNTTFGGRSMVIYYKNTTSGGSSIVFQITCGTVMIFYII